MMASSKMRGDKVIDTSGNTLNVNGVNVDVLNWTLVHFHSKIYKNNCVIELIKLSRVIKTFLLRNSSLLTLSKLNKFLNTYKIF